MQGRIVKLISNDYTVLCDDKYYVCKSRGKFRKLAITPGVGDNVIFDENKSYILEILPRKNSLVRPPVANIDQCVIVTCIKEHDFFNNKLKNLLVIIKINNIKQIICFKNLNKL